MSAVTYDIDPELLREFLDDAIDNLTPIEESLQQLGRNPENMDLINKVFRPFHSLKGNAPFFGLIKVKKLAHKVETLLDRLRNHELAVDETIISILISAVDLLHSMLKSVRDGAAELSDPEKYSSIIDSLDISKPASPEGLHDVISLVRQKLIDLETIVDSDKKGYVKDILNLIDSEAKEVNYNESPAPLKKILEIVQKEGLTEVDDTQAEIIKDCLKELKKIVSSNKARAIIKDIWDSYMTIVPKIGFDQILVELIREKFYLDTILNEKWKVENNAPSVIEVDIIDSPEPQAIEVIEPNQTPDECIDTLKKKEPVSSDNSEKTMRVSEVKIDGFLDYVGELLVVQEMFRFFGKAVSTSNIKRAQVLEFRRIMDTFDSLSDNMRKSILSIRSLPIKRVFQKLPRIVREVADQTDKKVDVEIKGEELLVDKSYIEILDAPLVHIIRNSIDHGIEPVETRLSSGKSEVGAIEVSAELIESNIVVTIQDDGGGIDFDAVRKKAVENSLIYEGETLTEEKLVDLLFEAGVSTAQEVTDISGRGVGMDVVRENIEVFGGTIAISSERGVGTRSTISLPRNVSTQIVDGFIVSVNNESYVLPMSAVIESFSPSDAEISTVTGKGTVVKRHDGLQSLVSIPALLKGVKSTGAPDNCILVSVEVKGEHYAFAVDKLLGVNKVVVKPVDEILFHNHFFGGAAITGDGRIAMVLDLDKMIEVVNSGSCEI